jgi:hypothetical protein
VHTQTPLSKIKTSSGPSGAATPGLSIGEISCETDWSWEVVRLGLRKAGVTAFNNHRNKPGLTWEPSDASEGSRANG